MSSGDRNTWPVTSSKVTSSAGQGNDPSTAAAARAMRATEVAVAAAMSFILSVLPSRRAPFTPRAISSSSFLRTTEQRSSTFTFTNFLGEMSSSL